MYGNITIDLFPLVSFDKTDQLSKIVILSKVGYFV